MTATATSIETYHAHIQGEGKGALQREKILAWMDGKGWVSRREISRGTGIETSSVAGRVNELVGSGQVEERIGQCPETKRTVKLVRVSA